MTQPPIALQVILYRQQINHEPHLKTEEKSQLFCQGSHALAVAPEEVTDVDDTLHSWMHKKIES